MSDAQTRRALLIVDIQSDYFAGGKMELVGSEPARRGAPRRLPGTLP
jgi:nicotinamidase-related amidase